MAKRYKRNISDLSKQNIRNNVNELVREANRRLEKLQRGGFVEPTKKIGGKFVKRERVTYDTGTWASKKLVDRLNSKNKKLITNNKISLNKNMTKTELKATEKALSQFLTSKTSTIKGIRETKKSTLKSLKKTFSDDSRLSKLTDKEIEASYNMLSDNNFQDLVEKIGSSTSWIIIDEAKQNNDNEERFLKRVSNYIDFGNDVDFKEKMQSIYNKLVL